MAGDIKGKFRAASSAITSTNLVSASTFSTGLLSGWTSNAITNTSNLDLDHLISGSLKVAAANAVAGTIAIYVISSLNDTPTWTATSAGTLGTESATQVTFNSSAQRDSIARLLCSITTVGTNGLVYDFPQQSVAALFGNGILPTNYCLWITNNATSSGAGLQATCSLYLEPVLAQYT
jgi:hypothetical protein